MRVLSHADIAALATVRDLIPVMDDAMRRVSARSVEMPLRFVVPLAPGAGFGVMTGAAPGIGHGAKLLSLMQRAHGSSHTGAVILFDTESGEPALLMESGLPTAMRTAAASALATDTLANPDAATVAILGTGEQAEWHIRAMRAVRPVKRVLVWGRTRHYAEALAARHDASVAASVGEACAEADIVCAATGATAPILEAKHLRPGAHLNAVGASLPSVLEIAPDCHASAYTVVDYRPAAEAQAGEIIAARKAGLIAGELPEIGEVLSGAAPGRTTRGQRTIYRSLGIIAQDLAMADYLLRRARDTGRGTEIDLYA